MQSRICMKLYWDYMSFIAAVMVTIIIVMPNPVEVYVDISTVNHNSARAIAK